MESLSLARTLIKRLSRCKLAWGFGELLRAVALGNRAQATLVLPCCEAFKPYIHPYINLDERFSMRMNVSRPAVLASAACATLLAVSTHTAHAGDINSVQQLVQSEFRLLSEDLGSTLSYKPLTPAASLGITGFDVGFAVTGTSLEHRDLWRKASSGASVDALLMVPTLRAHKGLPFNIDVGAAYSFIPSTNLRYLGGEVRWAPLPGSAVLPAVAFRLSGTQLTGVDQLGLSTLGADVTVSKGFVGFTPYGGIGTVRTTSTPKGVPQLREEKVNQTKLFAGINWNLALVNLAVEADKTGDAMSYGVKLGFRF
jgi:hypothetical protein